MLTVCAHHTCPVCWSNSPGTVLPQCPTLGWYTGTQNRHTAPMGSTWSLDKIMMDLRQLSLLEPAWGGKSCTAASQTASQLPQSWEQTWGDAAVTCAIKSRAIILLISSAPSGPCYICQPPAQGHTQSPSEPQVLLDSLKCVCQPLKQPGFLRQQRELPVYLLGNPLARVWIRIIQTQLQISFCLLRTCRKRAGKSVQTCHSCIAPAQS